MKTLFFRKLMPVLFHMRWITKTQLQEVLQRKGDVSIEYRLIKEEGPAHDRTFFTEVYMNGELIGLGQAKIEEVS